jgi:hypothetical protein
VCSVDSPAASACRTAMLFFVHKPIRKLRKRG